MPDALTDAQTKLLWQCCRQWNVSLPKIHIVASESAVDPLLCRAYADAEPERNLPNHIEIEASYWNMLSDQGKAGVLALGVSKLCEQRLLGEECLFNAFCQGTIFQLGLGSLTAYAMRERALANVPPEKAQDEGRRRFLWTMVAGTVGLTGLPLAERIVNVDSGPSPFRYEDEQTYVDALTSPQVLREGLVEAANRCQEWAEKRHLPELRAFARDAAYRFNELDTHGAVLGPRGSLSRRMGGAGAEKSL